MEKEEQKLLKEALAAYGIEERWVFAHRFRGDEVIVVTNGGQKVRFKAGDKPEKLTYTQVTGMLEPEETAFLPRLNQRIKVSELVKRIKKQ